MSRPILALATCRVSTAEQVQNNSLSRQKASVLKSAETLGAIIPDDCWWSGSVSSKRGTNVNRKDLNEMVERCKKDKRVKFVIVDEPDRFMRSIDEAAFFEVTFAQLGVKVWYASDPELNKGDLASKLLKFTKYLSAEGSNEERQRKSINGHVDALKKGRWTFVPKAGYKRGYERGIPEIHEVRGNALRKVLIDVAIKRVTPSQGLVNLNNSDFMATGHSLYKMDKFRKIVTDPFYAGILEIDKQVKVRNENGLHQALITKDQHYALIRIMSAKHKNQTGARKNGNPNYPLDNIVSCDLCIHKSNGRVVGFDHTNGKPNSKVYEKYRCRGCGRYISRQELHNEVQRQFRENPITPEGINDLKSALETVWKQRKGEAEQEENRLRHRILKLNSTIRMQAAAAIDPENTSIKKQIFDLIENNRTEIVKIEDRLTEISDKANYEKDNFLDFAYRFAENMGSKFLEIAPENRLRCKQIMFPAGFRWDKNKKVYTPEISDLIRLASNKKDLSITEKSLLVRVKRL